MESGDGFFLVLMLSSKRGFSIRKPSLKKSHEWSEFGCNDTKDDLVPHELKTLLLPKTAQRIPISEERSKSRDQEAHRRLSEGFDDLDYGSGGRHLKCQGCECVCHSRLVEHTELSQRIPVSSDRENDAGYPIGLSVWLDDKLFNFPKST